MVWGAERFAMRTGDGEGGWKNWSVMSRRAVSREWESGVRRASKEDARCADACAGCSKTFSSFSSAPRLSRSSPKSVSLTCSSSSGMVV